uniref:Ras-associating domain-containing protein n=2 Tax=Mesocestoides corti TaxID=53468 RepID=A0A5K3F1Y8_MESCO
MRAEVRITLRGRSESPPVRRTNLSEKTAFRPVESGNAAAAVAVRRHSVATTSQYAPISEDQLETTRQTIGLGVYARRNDSVPVTTFTRDLGAAATECLPPVHPRSAPFRAAAVGSNVNRNQWLNGRPSSGNFSSTFLINTPGHACVTRSKSFKTLRRCESTGFCKPLSDFSESGSFLARHASFETTLAAFSEQSDLYGHIPTAERSEDPSPRLRSVASIENFSTSSPNAKLPPAPPTATHRNGGAGMLTSNKGPTTPTKHQSSALPSKLLESTSSPSLERSAINIIMTGGGLESASSNQSTPATPKEMVAVKRLTPRPAAGRHYSRIQLPCTRASSRSNTHVMTDSLKLYEEQIFAQQISSGQRPLSWCLDVGCLDNSVARTPDENHSSGSPSATNSSSTMSSACSSSSSSNASHAAAPAAGPPKIGNFNRLACLRPSALQFSPSTDQSSFSPNLKSRNLSPAVHAARSGSPHCAPVRMHSPPLPPGAASRVPPRCRQAGARQDAASAAVRADPNATPEASTPNADEPNKGLLSNTNSCASSSADSFASTLSTVRPARPETPPSTQSSAIKEDPLTLATVRPDDSFPSSSVNSLSLLPPPPPWNNTASSKSAVRQLFVCPYCRALATMCRCSASLSSAATEDSPSFEENSEEEEEESTYAFSTLDSDFIAWMRLSVKYVNSSHPCYAQRQIESLAALTRQEITKIVNVFNTNSIGLRMDLAEGTNKLVGTIRVYINLLKPVKMSLRQTMRHLPPQSEDPSGGLASGGAIPDRLISFFLPRGGSRVLQLSGSTSTQEVVQCLLDRFHIQESASKFALYEHTLEANTIFSRKLPSSERPLSMVMHWVRSALAAGEEFAVSIRRKRIVLQENENWEVNWSDFTPAELTNFLRILEKEEAEYRNAIYFQYGLVRQQIEQRMAQISAHDRLLAARHSVATTCPPSEHLNEPDQHLSGASVYLGKSPPHASL